MIFKWIDNEWAVLFAIDFPDISRRTFYDRFKDWNRNTPAEAIRRQKLSEARRLLAESEMSITAEAKHYIRP